MHGLVNRAIQRFAEDTYGHACWVAAADAACPGLRGFETMLHYDDALTDTVVSALAQCTGTPREMLLEEIGVYLVSHHNTAPVRRLLRFGGDSYPEFLHSLDDLADRSRLAVPDLLLPPLELVEHAPGHFTLTAGPGMPGFEHALVGLLRAMADDYGALALVEIRGGAGQGSQIQITVAEAQFAEDRGFELSPAAVAP